VRRLIQQGDKLKRLFSTLIGRVAVFLLLILVSCQAYGQSYQSFKSTLEQIRERAKFKVGPFRIWPTLQFRDIGYDNNVYFQHEDNDPVSDFTATFTPQVQVYLLFRDNLILSLAENPEYVYYFEQKRERRWNNTLSPEFKYLFLDRFVLSGKYLRSNRRRRASSEFDVRANEIVNSAGGRFFYETARKTSFGLFGFTRKINYEDTALPGEEITLSRELNRREQGGNMELYYRLFAESYFFVTAGYTDYEFEHAQSSWRNSYSYQVYTGIRFPLLGKIRGTLSLGYKKLIPREARRTGFSGLVGNTSLNFRMWRFGFSLSYLRDCHFSYWTDNIFFTEDRYGTGVSYYLTRFLRIDYGLSHARAKYPEPMSVRMSDGSYQVITRKDVYRIHSVGLAFRVIENTGVGIRVNFWERDSNYYWENRKRVFVGGYVAYEF
jgi:hypothetical protein